MLNLSLAVYEAITPRKNSQNLMTLLCVTQLNRQHWVFIKKIHQTNYKKLKYTRQMNF